MKSKIYALVVIAICASVLLFDLSAGTVTNSVTLSCIGSIQQPTTGNSYLISVSGSNYQMRSGSTGQVLFQSPISSQVFNNVIGNCSVGSIISVERGAYTVSKSWTITNKNNIVLNFENGAILTAANNLNAPVLLLKQSNYCNISGVTIDGNAVNQLAYPVVRYPNLPMGISIEGENNIINSAYIYNVRMNGVDVRGNNVGTINSTIYTCGWNGWSVQDNFVGCYLENSEIAYFSDVGICSYGSALMVNNDVHDANGTTGAELPGSSAHYAIALESWSSNDFAFNNVIINNIVKNSDYGIVVNTAGDVVPMNNNTISGNIISKCSNPIILGSSYNNVSNNKIENGSGNNGIYLNLGASFNSIIGNVIAQGSSGGITVDGTSPNNIISNNTIANAGWACLDIESKGNNINQNTLSESMWGIILNAGATGNTLLGNNMTSCNYLIQDNNVPENTFIANTGYNPVGYIASPISGSTVSIVDSGSRSTWISGVVYSNSGSPKEIHISAGTVSSVVRNGVQLFTATNCSVTLQPGDTFSITFSLAPTVNVFGL